MSLALHLAQNVHSIIVSQGPWHLVVVHGQMVLLDAPKFGQPWWVDNFEHSGVAILPRDVVRVALHGIVEQLLEEVPKETTVCERRHLFVNTLWCATQGFFSPLSKRYCVQWNLISLKQKNYHQHFLSFSRSRGVSISYHIFSRPLYIFCYSSPFSSSSWTSKFTRFSHYLLRSTFLVDIICTYIRVLFYVSPNFWFVHIQLS